MKEEEGLYYPCSENIGADQLRSYRESGLRLCFRICRLLVFLCSSSYSFKAGFVRKLLIYNRNTCVCYDRWNLTLLVRSANIITEREVYGVIGSIKSH